MGWIANVGRNDAAHCLHSHLLSPISGTSGSECVLPEWGVPLIRVVGLLPSEALPSRPPTVLKIVDHLIYDRNGFPTKGNQ